MKQAKVLTENEFKKLSICVLITDTQNATSNIGTNVLWWNACIRNKQTTCGDVVNGDGEILMSSAHKQNRRKEQTYFK